MPVPMIPSSALQSLTTLQSGMGWFPQQAGGLNRMYHNLVRTLPALGVRVHGLVAGTGSVSELAGGTVTPFASPDAPLMSRWWAARREAKRVLRDVEPALVASHFALYSASWLDLIGDRPFVVHFHGPWAAEGAVEKAPSPVTRLKHYIERRVYARADRLIVLSDAFGQILQNAYDIPGDRIVRIPGGVDAAAFAPNASPMEARIRLDWPLNRPIVLAVRRLAPRMGLETLIDAMADVRRDVPDVLLLVAGTGPLDSSLIHRIRERGLAQHVRLLGFIPDADLPYAYRAATLSVVPTVALEGFGLITIESLAAGTPVLVTPVGGLPEVVAPLSDELVCTGTNRHDLADGLRRALLVPEVLPRTDACQSYVRTHFDWPLITRQIRDVYDDALRLAAR